MESNRMYATYLGGSGNEMPFKSIICDQQGNLIVAGRSNSSNYPVKPANNPERNRSGGFDIIVTKINAAGDGLVGSMRIGGTESDGANIDDYPNGAGSLLRNYGDEARSEVNIDNAGNIYLASCTQSGDFPVVSGFQGTKAGGQDGVVLKLSPDVSNLLFSTYLGGSGDDAAYVLATNPLNGNIYVAGGTGSSNFPGDHTGVIGPATFGGVDGFIAEISGTTLVRSTYLGTGGTDQIYGLDFDKSGFPYVTGQTTGSWPHVNAAFFNNGAKQFISKLKPDLSGFVYSTTFGTASNLPEYFADSVFSRSLRKCIRGGMGRLFQLLFSDLIELPERRNFRNASDPGCC